VKVGRKKYRVNVQGGSNNFNDILAQIFDNQDSTYKIAGSGIRILQYHGKVGHIQVTAAGLAIGGGKF
jgi:hypothetical protein